VADLKAKLQRVLEKHGTPVTIERVTQTYALDGAVTESVSTQVVTCSELLNQEMQIVGDGNAQRQVGGFVFSALNITVAPKPGDRVVWRARRFLITAVTAARFNGSVVAYRVAAGDLGAE
jgi:hypothetical protein